jgi:peptidoglycan hydrolase-like protein with peptidoglycan-binding domain
MSREQLNEQQTQVGAAESVAPTTDETYGLPKAVYAQVLRLSPGNVEGLRELLAAYPNFRQGILSVASHQLGATTVRQAIRPAPLTQEQIGPGGEFALEGNAPAPKKSPLTQEQIGPGGEFALEGNAPATPAAEPAWAGGARAYNEAHPELVSNFNALTGGSCLVDGKLDPQAVAEWQKAHGLDPDGKVGPLTVAAAKRAGAQNKPAKPDLASIIDDLE